MIVRAVPRLRGSWVVFFSAYWDIYSHSCGFALVLCVSVVAGYRVFVWVCPARLWRACFIDGVLVWDVLVSGRGSRVFWPGRCLECGGIVLAAVLTFGLVVSFIDFR